MMVLLEQTKVQILIEGKSRTLFDIFYQTVQASI